MRRLSCGRGRSRGPAFTTVAAFGAFGATAAFAGEVTGSGKYIAGSETAPLSGNSSCAFSGLNDNYVFGLGGAGESG